MTEAAYLSIRETCAILHLSRTWVNALIKRGTLTRTYPPLVDRASVEAYHAAPRNRPRKEHLE